MGQSGTEVSYLVTQVSIKNRTKFKAANSRKEILKVIQNPFRNIKGDSESIQKCWKDLKTWNSINYNILSVKIGKNLPFQNWSVSFRPLGYKFWQTSVLMCVRVKIFFWLWEGTLWWLKLCLTNIWTNLMDLFSNRCLQIWNFSDDS